jgi:hypothetical protein
MNNWMTALARGLKCGGREAVSIGTVVKSAAQKVASSVSRLASARSETF